MLPDPFFLSFSSDIKILKSFINFFLKKLEVNFIPVSKKILEKPKYLALFKEVLRFKCPSGSRGIL